MGKIQPGSWADRAWQTIDRVHETLPADATDEERRAALFAAYPFSERRYTPYKIWLKAQKQYLARYSRKPAGQLFGTPSK